MPRCSIPSRSSPTCSRAPTAQLVLLCALIRARGGDGCLHFASDKLHITAHLAALSSLLGLAIDHYLAICRPLYHLTEVSVQAVNAALGAVWLVSLGCSCSDIVTRVSSPICVA